MKKFFRIVASMILVGAFISQFTTVAGSKSSAKSIRLSTSIKRHGPDRSIFPDATAWYYPEEKTIEVNCSDTKETTVYLLDSRGEEISCDIFDPSISSFLMVDVPQAQGTYWLVIDSPVLYAEGSFIVE